MSTEMVEYTEAYRQLEEAVLIALDNAYSDTMNMDDAFAEIKEYVNASGCGDQTQMLEDIYEDWKQDYGCSSNVLQGSF